MIKIVLKIDINSLKRLKIIQLMFDKVFIKDHKDYRLILNS